MRRFLLYGVALVALAMVGGWLLDLPGGPLVNAPPPAGPIVAFGDSLTAGAGAGRNEAYPEVLARLIGRPVINRGVGGDTIESAAGRVERDVLAEGPGVVIVLLGGNDILRRLDLDRSFDELERVVRRIQASGAMVVLVGLRPFSPVGGVGGRYSALARRTGCVYVDDILDGIFANPRMMADQIHPNAAGYALMAERIAEALRPHLQ